MKRPFLYDPIKWLRDQGVIVRLGLPQGGKQELEVCFEKGRYWEAAKVQKIYRRVEQGEKLIRMQLNVEKGLPPRSVEYLLSRGLITTETRNGRRRYVITEMGKRWMN